MTTECHADFRVADCGHDIDRHAVLIAREYDDSGQASFRRCRSSASAGNLFSWLRSCLLDLSASRLHFHL